MSSLIELKDRDIGAYDMIVSTVPIPYENIDYIVVSPLLNEEDANQVKQYIKRKIPLILEKKRRPDNGRCKETDIPDTLKTAEKMGRYLDAIQHVLKNFTVNNIDTKPDDEPLPHQMFRLLEAEGLIHDAQKGRCLPAGAGKAGGLGIPETGMALYHLKNEEIVLPFLKIYDLSKPYEVNGMDGKPLSMSRVLVMMAPADLPAEGSEILSAISSAIIESKESMKAFQNEGEQALYQRLNMLFHAWMKENLYQ